MSAPSWSWPPERLGEALVAGANLIASGSRSAAAPPAASAQLLRDGGDPLERWLDGAAAQLGFEVEAVTTPIGDIEMALRRMGPALIRLQLDAEAALCLVVRSRRGALEVLTPRGLQRVATRELAELMRAPLEAALAPQIDPLLNAAKLPEARRDRVRQAIMRDRVRLPVGDMWMLRADLGESWWRQLKREGIVRALTVMLVIHAASYIALVNAWKLIGGGALAGRIGTGTLTAWLLLLLTTVPLHGAVVWLEGRFAIGLGSLLKRRLLSGVLRLDPDEIRHMGAGQLLGKVLESEAVEALALGGGVIVLLGLIELAVAGWVLSVGGGGATHAALLAAWMLLLVPLAWSYYRAQRKRARERIELTDDLVERMVGHRTRQAQMPKPRWHEGEDDGLDRYFAASERVDTLTVRLFVTAPRGWLLASFALLAPDFVAADSNKVGLAVALGGMLLAHQALNKMINSVVTLTDATIAAEQIAPIFWAAERRPAAGRPLEANERTSRDSDDPTKAQAGLPLLDGAELSYRYPGRGRPVLSDVSLALQRGDRVLLTGPSGGGKSTLAAVLLGLRTPDSGLLLLDGFDYNTLGQAGWRRRVAAAPQFHENHVLTGTFAFNLLMGRCWPPGEADLQLAEQVCVELGLGPLLERMPGGMLQAVGDTGWQLSHGEKSRLFIARAILQDAPLIVLDESFAALDPEALARAMQCVLERAQTLLVIAHP